MTDHRIPTSLNNFDGGGYSSPSTASSPAPQLPLDPTAGIGDFVPGSTRNPHPTDILCGRGCSTHHGNAVFRSVVRRHQPQYHASTKGQKVELARCIIRAVSMLDPPGRFLEKKKGAQFKGDGLWYLVEPKKALEKTKQALREKYNMKEDDDEYGMEEGDGAVMALEATLAQAEADAQAGMTFQVETGGGRARSGAGAAASSGRKRKVAPQSRFGSPPNADAAAGRPSSDFPLAGLPLDQLDAPGMTELGSIGAGGMGMDVPMPPLPGPLEPNAAFHNSSPAVAQKPAFRPPRSVRQRPSLVDFFFNVPSKLTNLSPGKECAASKPSAASARAQSAGSQAAHVHFGEGQGQQQQGQQHQQAFAAARHEVAFHSASANPAQRPPAQPRRRQSKRSSVLEFFRGSLTHFVGVEDQLMDTVFRQSGNPNANGGAHPGGGRRQGQSSMAADAAAIAKTFGASDQGGGTGIGEDGAILAGMDGDLNGSGQDPFDDAFGGSPGKKRKVDHQGQQGQGRAPSGVGGFGKELTRMAAHEIGRQGGLGSSSSSSTGRRVSRSGSIFKTFLRFSTPLDDDSHQRLVADCEKAIDEANAGKQPPVEGRNMRGGEMSMAAAAAAATAADEAESSQELKAEEGEEMAPPPTKRPRRESTYSLFSLFRPDADLAAAGSEADVSNGGGGGGGGKRRSVFQFMQLLGKAEGDDSVEDDIFADAEEDKGTGGEGDKVRASRVSEGTMAAAAAAAVASLERGESGEGSEHSSAAGAGAVRDHSLASLPDSSSPPSNGGPGQAGGNGNARRRSSVFNILQWGNTMMGEGWGDFTPV